MLIKNKKILGWILIVLGLIIVLTPFTPGSLLLLVGIDMIFGDKWQWWKKQKERFLKRVDGT